MSIKTLPRTLGVATSLALTLAAVPAAASAADASRPVHSPAPKKATASASATKLATYWTSERMKSAISADKPLRNTKITQDKAKANGPARKVAPAAGAVTATATQNSSLLGPIGTEWPGSQSLPPATTTGKIFFSKNGLNYSCSGSAVNSEAKNLVFTAGHCVHGGAGGAWVSNFVFVPAYRDGTAPYGVWAAKELWSLTGWTNSSDQRWDVGTAIMYPLGGWSLVNRVGGQGIAWNQAAEQYTYAFGYPSNKSSGLRLNYCDGWTWKKMNFIFWSGQIGLNCDMTFGASGGPWLMWFNGQYGYLHSVVSNGTPGTGRFHGPYFDTTIGNLYNLLRNRF